MENLNIFDEAKQGEFFKFEKVGDAVQGTYIGKTSGKSKFSDQIIYILQDTNGKVWNIGFAVDKKVVHEKMKGILFGQIVGFRFDEERPSDKGNAAKIIRIYADSKFIDRAWLATQKELGMDPNSGTYSAPVVSEPEVEMPGPNSDDTNLFNGKPYEFKVPEGASPASGSLPKTEEKPKNEALDAIRNLARTKGLTEGMDEKTADEAIEQFTGLKLEESNLTKIIIALTGYSKK